MSIDGRFNVDVLFHDTDGTNAISVLSLKDSDAFTAGSVAYWNGTCGTAGVTLSFVPTTYRDASGNFVSIQPGGADGRVAFLASGNGGVLTQTNGPISILSFGDACVSNIDEQESVTVAAYAGTTEYTVIILDAS